LNKRIRIIVIDPYPMFRAGVVQTIARADDMLLLAQGGSAEEARRLMTECTADVLILDISMTNGKSVVGEFARHSHACKVIILTALDDVLTVSGAIAAGAQGYILKGVRGVELVAAIRVINAGQPYVTPELASRLLVEARGNALAQNAKLAEILNTREIQVLRQMSKGRTNQEIAMDLGLHIGTVKYYVKTAFKKLKVTNRLQALQIFKRSGCD